MNSVIERKTGELENVLRGIEATGASGEKMAFNDALGASVAVISGLIEKGKKVMLVGNGASSSIAGHIAVDFWKNAGVPAITFNDSALLTCISNDYGYKHVFQKPVERFAAENDLLIAISSSGQSENIIRAVKQARRNGAGVLSLSGFDKDNPLRSMGDVNFYAPSDRYGYVEIAHHFICHCLVDIIAGSK